MFALTIPEERHSFRRVCGLLDQLLGPAPSVTEFNDQMSNASHAYIFVGLTTWGKGESTTIAAAFSEHGFFHGVLARSAPWRRVVRVRGGGAAHR